MDPAPLRHADDEAFLRQFMVEERTLLRFIFRYVPAAADARDVLQETLVTLWAKRAEFDASREFLPWACGIARFKVREFWRKQPRWEAFAHDDLMGLIDHRREELAPELSLRGEKLRDCIAKLPPVQRSALDHYYTKEESVETLALREGRSVEAIYKMLQRIRHTLLVCIERGVRAERTAS
jgi:RNA polymerase sigma-70 factor (ECF subfamily)